MVYYDKSGSRIYRPLQRRTPSADSAPDNECQLCGAPGGYPYCNANCEAADNPEDDAPTITAADFGPLTDTTDPWAIDARNHR